MKKLIIALAAIFAATLFSGGAFAVPGGAAKAIEAPVAAVKIHYGCGRPHHYYHGCHRCGGCGGYYSNTYVYATPCGGYSGCGCGGCGGCGWSCGCGGWGGWGGGFLGGFFGW
jgi:hypothetical protein